MELTEVFVLPAGSALQPVSELSEELRREIGFGMGSKTGSGDGDFALSRANSRARSKVVDAEAAELLRQFENPSTIAQAVARFSRVRSMDPEQLLEDSLPFLQSLIAERMLVTEGGVKASTESPLPAGENVVDGWTILQCVQTLEDGEVYQVRGPDGQLAALKLACPAGDSQNRSIGATLAREARLLLELEGAVTPRLLGTGAWIGRAYLLVEWFAGTDAHSACDEYRRRGDAEGRRHLLRIAGNILEAYAHLHEQGVIHGDIHPRNILVDRHEAVRIIDLGLARRSGEEEQPERGGVSFFFEPEFAGAVLAGERPPQSSLAGEQYGLAALLYLLLTGSHSLEFTLEKEPMLRQIAESPATPFAGHGVDAWPDVEQLLLRALSKDPAKRFPSTREFARAWGMVAVPQPVTEAMPGEDSSLRDIRRRVLRASALRGEWLQQECLPAPATSVNFGSAGVAYGLFRMACASDDAELLAVADVWSARSVGEIGNEGAFYNRDLEITPKTVGSTSLYHSPAGVYVVQALIAQARGDFSLQCAATDSFLQFCGQPSTFLDVTLGRSGLLLGCVFLLDALGDEGSRGYVREYRGRLQACGREIRAQLWETIGGYAPIDESKDLSNLGVAHGWAGLLYATLVWCAASGDPFPPGLADRLHQLAACAEPASRGLHWTWDLSRRHQPATNFMPGWCNGSAGYVFLWTEAHRATGEEGYLQLAEGAAWHVWESQGPVANLCCGMAGQVYALLRFYRHTRQDIWLRRARDLARGAAHAIEASRGAGQDGLDARPESLYKGDLGIAVLAADLQAPEQALMPMFERERND